MSDGKYNYAYDNEGNRTKRTEIATGEITEYVWDYRNRLTQVVTKNASGTVIKQAEYAYDIFDRRISKTVDPDGAGAASATIERLIYDGEHIALTFDGNGTQTHRYLHGTEIDQILASENAQGEVLWALTDNQGTVRDLVDSTGTIQNHITYDSFGQIINETNTAIDTRFGYTGREFDEETGQYYYRARYLSNGQFISEDPIGFNAGDSNLYRYVGNSPTNFTDPSGLIVANLVGAGIGGGADLGLQLLTNGGDISQVNWTSVAVSSVTGSLGFGLTAKVASLSVGITSKIALNAAGSAVLGAGDRAAKNALEGRCLGDGVLTSALIGGGLGAAGEGVGVVAPQVIKNLKGAFGSADDVVGGVDNAVGALEHSLINTGGRFGDEIPLTSSTKLDDYTRWIEYAPESYDAIRNTNDDVMNIARNTGWPEYRIQRMKNHLFHKEHQLGQGVSRFDPDPDIADAWARLRKGEHNADDLRLLQHEYFESKFESIFRTDYRTAHDAAIRSGRTWHY